MPFSLLTFYRIFLGTAISKEEVKKSWWDIKVNDRHAAELGLLLFDKEAFVFPGPHNVSFT